MEKTHYEVLNVKSDADIKEIKSQYKKLAGIHHPDKKGGDKALFAEISVAFGVLKNERSRALYDISLREKSNQYSEQSYTKEKPHYKSTNSSYKKETDARYSSSKNTSQSPKSDLFDYDVDPKSIIVLNLEIKPKESINGCIREIFYTRIILCYLCEGAGKGVYKKDVVACPHCLGTGFKSLKEKIRVIIPPNSMIGSKLQITGKGNGSKTSKINGHLHIYISWGEKWQYKNGNLYSFHKINNKEIKQGFFILKIMIMKRSRFY